MTEQQAREAERKAIADYIRYRIVLNGWDVKTPNFHNYNFMADAIERGEHLKGKS